jgi:hypothetical protein
MISEMQPADSQQSVVTEWSVLETQLEKLGLPKEVIEEEFFFISDWLKEHFLEQVEEDEELPENFLKQVEEDDEPPDYTPGERRKPVDEKVQDLDETTRNLAIAEPVATSSKAEPPPYTFEEGSDQPMMDSEFLQFIRTSTAIEAEIRSLQRKQHPELGSNSIFWLPKSIQAQYRDSNDIIPIMPANSFTAMAYETVPRCVDKIERLRRLLRTSFEHKPNTMNTGAVHEAFQSLEVMSSAMSKFALVQDQRSGADNFSDLDTLDFEFSTAVVLDEHMHFPDREFELAQ